MNIRKIHILLLFDKCQLPQVLMMLIRLCRFLLIFCCSADYQEKNVQEMSIYNWRFICYFHFYQLLLHVLWCVISRFMCIWHWISMFYQWPFIKMLNSTLYLVTFLVPKSTLSTINMANEVLFWINPGVSSESPMWMRRPKYFDPPLPPSQAGNWIG